MEQLFAAENAPFTIALGVMVCIALMEGLGLLVGVTVSGLVDSVLPDFDAPDFDVPEVDFIDADVPGNGVSGLASPDVDVDGVQIGGLFTRLLGWLSFGQVPALIWLVIFLTGFGLSGIVIQNVFSAAFGAYLPAWLAVGPALFTSLPATRYIGRGFGRLLPKDESEAVSRDQFKGRVVTVIRGVAEAGKPAEAKLTDQYGQTHYLLVEPDMAGTTFEAGNKGLIVSGSSNVFRIIETDSAAL